MFDTSVQVSSICAYFMVSSYSTSLHRWWLVWLRRWGSLSDGNYIQTLWQSTHHFVHTLCICTLLLLLFYMHRFVLMVKRGYRDPPYHNWYHALSVAHCCYVLHQNCDHLSFLSDLEILALFFSCLCHDIDHRGTNNSFQISSVSLQTSYMWFMCTIHN